MLDQLALLLGLIALDPFEATCEVGGRYAGSCPWADINDDGSVDVGDDITWPGDPGTPPSPDSPGDNHHDNDNSDDGDGTLKDCLDKYNDSRFCFTPQPPTEPGEPATPTITITDLATFLPTPAPLTAEPDNIGITGKHTNLYTTTTTHTAHGTLFDHPITVRFTPIEHHFDYGDTTTLTTTNAGSSWTSLNLPTFAPTPTSHIFTARGTYTATHTPTYTAELNLGNGWYTIPGTLTGPTSQQTIIIYTTSTTLVTGPCTTKPTAPGC
ncbi:hypothetical protein [Microbacterium sp. YY-01]|uniref:hypothetical protein n=1 Tax=Microbacterium sp. YY-01 TaxID=3421634 RepID=UPI003D164D71